MEIPISQPSMRRASSHKTFSGGLSLPPSKRSPINIQEFQQEKKNIEEVIYQQRKVEEVKKQLLRKQKIIRQQSQTIRDLRLLVWQLRRSAGQEDIHPKDRLRSSAVKQLTKQIHMLGQDLNRQTNVTRASRLQLQSRRKSSVGKLQPPRQKSNWQAQSTMHTNLPSCFDNYISPSLNRCRSGLLRIQ